MLIYQVPGRGRIYKVYAGFVAVPYIGDPSFHVNVGAALDAVGAPRGPVRRSRVDVADELRRNA